MAITALYVINVTALAVDVALVWIGLRGATLKTSLWLQSVGYTPDMLMKPVASNT